MRQATWLYVWLQGFSAKRTSGPQCRFESFKYAFSAPTALQAGSHMAHPCSDGQPSTHCSAGYGSRSPKECWISAWLVMAQCIWAMLLNAVTLGIIFARISHPKQRGRTVFLSDSAVIARRDGILKFMFRVADIRQTQVQQGC